MPNATSTKSTPRGTIHIVIGPNGYGKTTFLNDEKTRLDKAGKSVFFIPSEIKGSSVVSVGEIPA